MPSSGYPETFLVRDGRRPVAEPCPHARLFIPLIQSKCDRGTAQGGDINPCGAPNRHEPLQVRDRDGYGPWNNFHRGVRALPQAEVFAHAQS